MIFLISSITNLEFCFIRTHNHYKRRHITIVIVMPFAIELEIYIIIKLFEINIQTASIIKVDYSLKANIL